MDLSYYLKLMKRQTGPTGKIRFPSWQTACKIADAQGISLDRLRGILGP